MREDQRIPRARGRDEVAGDVVASPRVNAISLVREAIEVDAGAASTEPVAWSAAHGAGQVLERYDLYVTIKRGGGVPPAHLLASTLSRMRGQAFLLRLEAVQDDVDVATIAVSVDDRWCLVRVALGSDGSPPDAADSNRMPSHVRTRHGRAASKRRRGFVVALYGVDGSGKGTVVREVVRTLGGTFDGVCRWHLFEPQHKGAHHVPVTDPYARAPRSAPASVVKIGWYLVRAWLLRAPRVWRARRAGYLTILDRDVADPWLDPLRYRIGLPRRYVSILHFLGPRPDVALVLDADEADVFARTDEVPPELAPELLARYRAFASQCDWTVMVNARGSIEAVAFDACRFLFARLDAHIREQFEVATLPTRRRDLGASSSR